MSKKVTHTDWTSAQRQAIEAGPSEKILVDAGPGTGKTATACARERGWCQTS